MRIRTAGAASAGLGEFGLRRAELYQGYVAKAGDAYVSHWLYGAKVAEVPKDLIELGRAKIALSRELRSKTK